MVRNFIYIYVSSMTEIIKNHNILIFIAIIAILILCCKIIKYFTHKLFVAISSYSKINIRLLENLITPSSFLITFSLIFIAYILLLHNQYEKIDYLIFKAVEIVEVLAVFWFSYNLLASLVLHFAHHKKIKITNVITNSVMIFLLRIIRILIIAITAIFILDICGINVLALVAGLGLVGIAVALAAQDTLKNFFASLVILLDQVFVEGDYIKIDTIEGYIKHIGFRSTILETNNQAIAFIPNSKFADSIVLNLSKIPHRAILIKLTIGRLIEKEMITKFIDDIKKFTHDNPAFIAAKSSVYINTLKNGTIDLLCSIMSNKNIDDDILLLMEEIIEIFTKIAKNNNIELYSITIQK